MKKNDGRECDAGLSALSRSINAARRRRRGRDKRQGGRDLREARQNYSARDRSEGINCFQNYAVAVGEAPDRGSSDDAPHAQRVKRKTENFPYSRIASHHLVCAISIGVLLRCSLLISKWRSSANIGEAMNFHLRCAVAKSRAARSRLIREGDKINERRLPGHAIRPLRGTGDSRARRNANTRRIH